MKNKKMLVALGLSVVTFFSSEISYAMTEQKPAEPPVEQGVAEKRS